MDERFEKLLAPSPAPFWVTGCRYNDPASCGNTVKKMVKELNLWLALSLASKTALERATVLVWYYLLRPAPGERTKCAQLWLVQKEGWPPPSEWPEELAQAFREAIQTRPNARALLRRALQEKATIPDYVLAKHLRPLERLPHETSEHTATCQGCQSAGACQEWVIAAADDVQLSCPTYSRTKLQNQIAKMVLARQWNCDTSILEMVEHFQAITN